MNHSSPNDDMRLHITGNAGSGKTTLAKRLGEELGVSVYSLDSVVWKAGWTPATKNERELGERKLVSKECWIIEGVSKIVRESSDFVIFLDVPRYVCLFRCFKRSLCYLFRSRPELPENCPEILIIPRLTKLIWSFPNLARPAILNSLKKQNGLVLDARTDFEDLVLKIRKELL